MTLNRRGFVSRLGIAGMSLSAPDLFAQPVSAPGPWDTSWLDKIAHRPIFRRLVEDLIRRSMRRFDARLRGG